MQALGFGCGISADGHRGLEKNLYLRFPNTNHYLPMRKLITLLLLIFWAGLAKANELVPMIQAYQADRGALSRLYTNRLSMEYFTRMESFNKDYLSSLQAQNYGALSEDGKIDYVLFRNY